MVQDLDGLFHRFLGMNLLLRNYFFWSFMCKKSHILARMLGFKNRKQLKYNILNIFNLFLHFFSIFLCGL